MAVLADVSIRRAIQAKRLFIRPFYQDAVEPASYDMRLYWKLLISPTRYERGKVVDLRREPANKYQVLPGRFVGILTQEVLGLPADIAARFGLRSEFTRRGLVAFGGIQVDPGFKGRLAISLFHAGPESIELEYRRKMFTVEFHNLDVAAEKPYSGAYQGLRDFDPDQQKFILNANTVSLAEIALLPNEVASLQMRVAQHEMSHAPTIGAVPIDEVARAQGVSVLYDSQELGGGWPEDEDVDAFLAAIRKPRSRRRS